MAEATLIFLDNSQYSINGDYPQSRWGQQIQAAGVLIPAKLQSGHQSSVGLGLLAGRQVEVICPPTNDPSKVESFLYGIKQSGLIKLCHALQIGALALKHRADPNLKQRIICFIASAVSDTKQELRIIGKKLKKNQIAVDLICIGDLSKEQKQKLNLLNESLNHQDNSQIIFIQPNVTIIEALTTSKIFGGAQNQINEVDDPQLALALRLSLEQAQRQNLQQHSITNQNNRQNNNQMQIENQQAQLQQRALQLSLQSLNENQSSQKNKQIQKDQQDKNKDCKQKQKKQ